MKNSVIIKSFQHGISLHLPNEGNMEDIIEKVSSKFSDSAAFFKDAKMVLSIEGRILSDEEEKALEQKAIENASSNDDYVFVNGRMVKNTHHKNDE